jgi:hypothetical protein
MIEKRSLILTGNDAELLSQVLEEVKAKVYTESGASLDYTQSLNTLVSCFRDAAKPCQEKETLETCIGPSDKRLVLGTIVSRCSRAKRV